MIPKHMYRTRRAGLIMMMLGVGMLPGVDPEHWGLLILCAALIIFACAAFAAASHPIDDVERSWEAPSKVSERPDTHGIQPAEYVAPPAPPITPEGGGIGSSAAANAGKAASQLADVLAEVVDIHRGRAAVSDASDVVHVPVLKVAMRPDEKDLRP